MNTFAATSFFKYLLYDRDYALQQYYTDEAWRKLIELISYTIDIGQPCELWCFNNVEHKEVNEFLEFIEDNGFKIEAMYSPVQDEATRIIIIPRV